MPEDTESKGSETQTGAAAEVTPPLRDYLWRPWFAKAWWGAILLFWSVLFLADTFFKFPRPWQLDGGIEWMMLLFHPFTAVFGLGMSFVFAWKRFQDRNAAPADEGGRDGDDMVGDPFVVVRRRRSITDPMNISAIANPANPSSQAWRDQNLYGKH